MPRLSQHFHSSPAHRFLRGCFIGAAFAAPSLVSADQSLLLVASFLGDSLARFDAITGAPLGVFGPSSGLDAPLCMRVGPDGLLYVASEGNDTIRRYDAHSGAFIDVFVTAGSGGLNAPTSLAWGSDGHLYVASFETDSILRYHGSTGAFLGVFVAPGSGGLNGPDNGTTFGPDGHLYVPSYWTNRILRYHGTSGAFLGVFVFPIGRPRVLVFDGATLAVTSETADAVYSFDASTGASLGFVVAPGTAGLDEPIGLAKGPDNEWFVSSGSQGKVYRFGGPSGKPASTFLESGTPGLATPVFLTVVDLPPSADLDGDGDVDAADLAIVLGSFGSKGPGDLDGSGTVGASDIAILLGAWTG